MGDGVEVGAPRTFGFAATELVDEHDSIPELSEVLEGQKIVVRHPWSAVEAEHGPFRGRSIGAIEELEAQNLDVPFGRFHAIPGPPEYEVRRWSFWSEPRPRPDAGEPTLPDDSDEPRSRDVGTVLHLGRTVVGKIGRPAARFWKPTMYLLRQTHATPRSSGVHGIRQGFAQEKNHMLGTYGLGVPAPRAQRQNHTDLERYLRWEYGGRDPCGSASVPGVPGHRVRMCLACGFSPVRIL